jgi:hypothetical protein
MTLTQIKPAGLSKPVDLADNEKIRLGTGNDLQIYHNGSNSYVQDVGTGNLHLTSNGTAVSIDKGTSENMAVFNTDGSVELFYDNVKRFETTNIGAQVNANNSVDGLLVTASSEGTVTVADERGTDFKASFVMAGSAPVIRNQNTTTSDSTLSIQKGSTTVANWDGNGIYTSTKQPAFYAKNTAGDQDMNSNDTYVTFNNEIFDRTNSYDTSTSTFTAPVAGVYYFTFGCCLSGVVDNFSYFFVRPMINNSDQQLETMMPRPNGGSHPGLTGSFIFELSANDTVRLQARAPAVSGSVGARIRGDQRWFAGHKLS